jgi:hypothetical protein
MKKIERLVAAIALTLLLGAAAFAGETNAPPCAPPVPGETNAPPCTGQTTSDNSVSPGVISTQPASGAGTEYLVAEAAITLFESLLPLY